MDAIPSSDMPAVITAWWWPVLLYVVGLLTQRVWEVSKWIRDRRRTGEASGVVEYFKHYNLMAFATLAISLSFFWLWKSEAMQLTALGFELHIPFVPNFAFVMGFFSDGFAIYFLKMFRNFKNRLTGQPL
jgi:hypothetical protein